MAEIINGLPPPGSTDGNLLTNTTQQQPEVPPLPFLDPAELVAEYAEPVGIWSIEEVAEGRDAGDNLDLEHRYTRVFQIRTKSPMVTGKQVRRAPGLPQAGELYRVVDQDGTAVTDPKSVVVDREMSQPFGRDDPTFWLARVRYAGTNSPELVPWEVSLEGVPYRQAVTKDRSDPPKVLQTSAKTPFDPPVEVDQSRIVIRITRNEKPLLPGVSPDIAMFDLAKMARFQHAVNGDTFTVLGASIEPYRAKLCIKAATRFRDGGRWYWRVSYEIDLKRGSTADTRDNDPDPFWYPNQILDAGFYKKNPTEGGRPLLIPTGDGFTPTAHGVLLNGTGDPKAPEAAAVYLPFQLYKLEAFSPLLFDANY